MANAETGFNPGIKKSLALYPTRQSRRDWAEFKKLELLTLLMRCRFTNIPVLAALWGGMTHQRARANVRDFRQQGIIARHTLPGSGRRILMLTRRGARMARSMTGLTDQARVDPLCIGQQIIHHMLMMQMAAVILATKKAGSGLSDMELLLFDNTVRYGPQRYKPSVDVCIAGGGIETSALPTANESDDGLMVEIELHRKSRSRLDEKIAAFAAILDEGETRYGWVLYVAPSGPVRDGLERAIAAYRDDHRNACRHAARRVLIASPEWVNKPL